ncbi:MAG: branched-chain amino acid ABC transporter substrate-binding protein, partial [Micromonosporaceae bacterium]
PGYGAPPPPPPGASGKGKGGLIAALVAGGAVLVLLICGGLVWAFSGDGSDPPTIDDKPVDAANAACGKKLAFLGPTSGEYGETGAGIRNGAKLAVDEFRDKNPECKIELVEYDTKDARGEAAEAAEEIAKDESIIGVVGPVYSVDAPPAAPKLDKAGVAMISPTASKDDLTDQGWKAFHRLVAPDSTQASASAEFLDQFDVTRVLVVSDENVYFRTLAKVATERLGEKAVRTVTFNSRNPDFTAIAKWAKANKVDGTFFSGLDDSALKYLRKIRGAGVVGPVVAPSTAYNASMAAEARSHKWFWVSCVCAPPTADSRFTRAYSRAYDKEPGYYAAEAYDAAMVFLRGVVDKRATRAEMLEYVHSYQRAGITKKIKFDDKGGITPDLPVFFYRAEKHGFEYDRRID